jgi:hypothetical protein
MTHPEDLHPAHGHQQAALAILSYRLPVGRLADFIRGWSAVQRAGVSFLPAVERLAGGCTVKHDLLRAERARLLRAIAAASDAMQRLAPLITEEPLSGAEARKVLRAVRLVAAKQTDALSCFDRFVLHGSALGFDEATRVDLDRGRGELAESLGFTLSEAERITHLLDTATGV